MFPSQLLVFCCFQLVLSKWSMAAPTTTNLFFYQQYLNGKGNKDSYYNNMNLHVDSTFSSVFALRGGNATLPCRFWYKPELGSPREVRIKWSRFPVAGGPQTDVLVAVGSRNRIFREFRQDFAEDASLDMTQLGLNDSGRYVCEVVDGLEDKRTTVDLELRGVVFPYQHPLGRYYLSFMEAQQVCEKQDATLATFTQLFHSWEDGLNWCNAGWLADGTVQYPITQPRAPCGGYELAPGIRNYGRRQLTNHRYDAFCFSSFMKGQVYYFQPFHKMNLTEARQACETDKAQIAKVGQLYAAWKYTGLDECNGGWLDDGSVRYPITRPRKNCGPSEPGVRNFGFLPPQDKWGVYCYKEKS
ncbi:hyaluronan and proteoglycan link protein 3-like isoform X2 [Corythoichthys intestinalis]|uniref:hyaluronan and proteoglycan link protein 3-like isoform X2 n=1 Tax=Corythoichthys intestinalis TaxID=161448 RepID=UPI0025A67126|nr:hyaluronan and proteoglycan link protein 3-like isoform X2 [Corythoichthys intestinalis]